MSDTGNADGNEGSRIAQMTASMKEYVALSVDDKAITAVWAGSEEDAAEKIEAQLQHFAGKGFEYLEQWEASGRRIMLEEEWKAGWKARRKARSLPTILAQQDEPVGDEPFGGGHGFDETPPYEMRG